MPTFATTEVQHDCNINHRALPSFVTESYHHRENKNWKMGLRAYICFLFAALLLLAVGLAVAEQNGADKGRQQPSGQEQQQDPAKIPPLLDAYLYDNIATRILWLRDSADHNVSLVANRTTLVPLQSGQASRNVSSFRALQPSTPMALAVGSRVIAANASANICEFDMARDGALVRCLALSEAPVDIVHLPPGPTAGQAEQLLVVLPSSQRIGAIDYQSFQYVGTWISLPPNAGNVSIEHEPFSDTVLVSMEALNVVYRYARNGGGAPSVWASVPRPRYISVVPYVNQTYVLSAEADVCELYTFRTQDGASLGASGSSAWCDRQKRSYSFGVMGDKAYRLDSVNGLQALSVYNGLARDSGAQQLLSPLAALARSDDDTGDLGLLDGYAWRNAVEDVPQPLAACSPLASGATLSDQVLAMFACPQQPGRLIVVDPRSAYALYQNTAGSWCFQRHFYLSSTTTGISSATYNEFLDELYLSPGNNKLTSVCADAVHISVQHNSNTTTTVTCPLGAWCSSDGMFMVNGSSVHVNGVFASAAAADVPRALASSQGHLFGLFYQAGDSALELRWFRPLDSNFTSGQWTHTGSFAGVQDALPRLAVRSWPKPRPSAVIPDPCILGVCATGGRSPWPWILLGVGCGVIVLVIIACIVAVVVRRHNKRKQQQYSGLMSTDWREGDGTNERLMQPEDRLPCSSFRKLIRKVFCSCACCWDPLPPGKLRFCSSCLGGVRSQSVQPYRELNEQNPHRPQGGNFTIAGDQDDSLVPPAQPPPTQPAVMSGPPAAGAPAAPKLPAARGDSFTGSTPFTAVDLYGAAPSGGGDKSA